MTANNFFSVYSLHRIGDGGEKGVINSQEIYLGAKSKPSAFEQKPCNELKKNTRVVAEVPDLTITVKVFFWKNKSGPEYQPYKP